MSDSVLRVGIFGFFGGGNFGNDGTLEAALESLRSQLPNAELTCICVDPNKVTADYGVSSRAISSPAPKNKALLIADRLLLGIPRRLFGWLDAFRFMRGFEILLIPGTGVLDDFGSRPWEIPYGIFRWSVTARLAGAKVAFVSVGAGPMRHWMSRFLMKRAASIADFRSYRDQLSKDFMTSIGFQTAADDVTPDLAFLLPTPSTKRRSIRQGGPINVGLGVMMYHGWVGDVDRGDAIYRTYLNRLCQFARWVLDQGHTVRLIVGETTDQAAVNHLMRMLLQERPGLTSEQIHTDPTYSLHDVMRHMANTDIVVATRFHNIVCALKVEKPTISLGYACKNDALMADMGLPQFCQHVEELDIDKLIEQFEELLRDHKIYEQRIREKNDCYRKTLMQQAVHLRNFMISAGVKTTRLTDSASPRHHGLATLIRQREPLDTRFQRLKGPPRRNK